MDLSAAFEAAVSKFGAVDICVNNAGIMDESRWEKMTEVNVVSAFEAAVSKFGAVDICVNNAGIMDERVWEKMIAINLTAQIRGCQLALDHMRRDRGGRVSVIAIFDLESFTTGRVQATMLEVEDAVHAFMKMLRDQDSDDVIFEVWRGTGGKFRRRQLVDSDGVSNPVIVDNPLPK
nr:hypothetical protein BaRGS_019087 [Batillaria attramentaria]